jgi:hypothetical protein
LDLVTIDTVDEIRAKLAEIADLYLAEI